MRIGIVGCGSTASKRAAGLGSHTLAHCADPDVARAERLAAQYPGARASADPRRVFDDPEVDAVLVATPHHLLAALTMAAVQAGKHVLVEKPGGRSSAELEAVIEAARDNGAVVKVGFNHRFHPSLQKAKQIFDAGGIGEIAYIRARYGHGGRLGYEHEWRADPHAAGGGELLDQGSHLIDLSRWFGGEFDDISGHVANTFWRMPVEDNAFVCLKSTGGVIAWLHASWTEWKNLFSFEIFGRTGKLQIDGLGGSYGTERLTYYRMLPRMGPPETTAWEYPGNDRSWGEEFEHFVACIASGGELTPCGSLEDALANLRIVEEVYRLNHRDYHP
jgi:predicted dehydrogenase